MATYEEVVGSEDEGQPDDLEDEDALEEQEKFERKYNFRFEEPSGTLASGYNGSNLIYLAIILRF